MSITGVVFISILLLYALSFVIAMYMVFKAARVPAWKAFIPAYNIWVLIEVVKRPKWWILLFLLPYTGIIALTALLIDTINLYGKNSIGSRVLVSLLHGPYLIYLASRYAFKGNEDTTTIKQPMLRGLGYTAVFMLCIFCIKAFVSSYTIPTSSNEKTIMVGDYISVTNFSYGIRLPRTPLALPFTHHTIGNTGINAYSEAIKWPYIRLMGSKVERNDIVVFNFPIGDTIIKEFGSVNPYYNVIQQIAAENDVSPDMARTYVWQNFNVITRPVDMREIYIKRCVGIAGDNIAVKDGVLYVNGKAADEPKYMSMLYYIKQHPNAQLSKEQAEELQLEGAQHEMPYADYPALTLTKHAVKVLLDKHIADSIIPILYTDANMFGTMLYPIGYHFGWTPDNYGPIHIPAKGETVTLNDSTYALYSRCISSYEGNTLSEVDGKYFINGKEASSYTFTMDYYWMMGDNRHQSQDSRYWGFVPEDHISGKAWFNWFSYDKQDNKIRWNRILKKVDGE